MVLNDEQIKELLEWFVNSSVQNENWSEKRDRGLEEHHKWIQPDTIKSLSDEELEERFLSYYKSGTGNRQKLNQVNRDRIIRDKEKFRITVTYLLDESIGIEERLNQVLKGDYHIKGCGRALATAFLMDFNPKKYCLWNGKTDMGFDVLGWDVYEKADTPGVSYKKVLEALNRIKNLRPELNLSLLSIDFFLHTISAEEEGIEAVNKIKGIGYLILSYKEDSPWDDEFGKSYHYGPTVPNHKKINSGSKFLLLKKNIGFVGSGEIGNVETEDSPPDGPNHFRATFKDFEPLDPTIVLSDEIRNAIASLPGYNVQHSIKVVNKNIFDMVLSPGEISTTYWQIAPGDNAKLWDDLLNNSIAAVGFSKIDEDLSGISKDSFMKKFRDAFPDFNERRTKIKSGQLWNFINLKPGDKFITNKGKSLLLGLGLVNGGGPFLSDNLSPELSSER
ncbi:hypothetical protein ACFL2S_15010, partial [Thermodesulfobacteriota bacterium]